MSRARFEKKLTEIFNGSIAMNEIKDDTIWFSQSMTMYDAILWAFVEECAQKRRLKGFSDAETRH